MTNIIVECNQCKHQYKVEDNRIGEKFHCYCGELLTVPTIKTHDAAVVRCSSCGGARGKELEPYCRYCGSSFTLHERDLNTICPRCMTRISSKAKFCHSCATPIVGDSGTFEKTKLPCPNCKNKYLHSRQMYDNSSFNLKECSHCAGIWISSDVFHYLEQKAQRESVSGLFEGILETRLQVNNQVVGNFYRNCPSCEVLMNRKNYAKSSGVVTDVCRKHGIWFDMGELDKILSFIRSGKLLKHQERAARKAKHATSEKKSAPLQNTNFSHNTVYDLDSSGDFFAEIIDWIVD